MIAVSRVSVKHDGRGGTTLDPLVWDQGGRKKHREVDIRINVDLAPLPGPPGFLHGPWVQVHGVVSPTVLGLVEQKTVEAPQSQLFVFVQFLDKVVHMPDGVPTSAWVATVQGTAESPQLQFTVEVMS